DDFLLEEAGLLDEPEQRTYRTRPNGAIDWIAKGTIVFGIVAVSYFACELYPLLWNLNVKRLIGSFANEPVESILIAVEDDDPPAVEISSVTAGANTPVALPENGTIPHDAVQVSKRPQGESPQ